MGLGIVQTLQDRKGDAAHSLLRATDLDPDYLPSYAFLAPIFGSVPAADVEIRRKLEVLVISHPESAEAHFHYARVLWKEKLLGPAGPRSGKSVDRCLGFRHVIPLVRDIGNTGS